MHLTPLRSPLQQETIDDLTVSKLPEKSVNPFLKQTVNLISTIVRSCHTAATLKYGDSPFQIPEGEPLVALSDDQFTILFSSVTQLRVNIGLTSLKEFLGLFLSDTVSTEPVVSMLLHCAWKDKEFSFEILQGACDRLCTDLPSQTALCKAVIRRVMSLDDDLRCWRLPFGASHLIESINTTTKDVLCAVNAVNFVQTSLLPYIGSWLTGHKEAWVEPWLFHKNDRVRLVCLYDQN